MATVPSIIIVVYRSNKTSWAPGVVDVTSFWLERASRFHKHLFRYCLISVSLSAVLQTYMFPFYFYTYMQCMSRFSIQLQHIFVGIIFGAFHPLSNLTCQSVSISFFIYNKIIQHKKNVSFLDRFFFFICFIFLLFFTYSIQFLFIVFVCLFFFLLKMAPNLDGLSFSYCYVIPYKCFQPLFVIDLIKKKKIAWYCIYLFIYRMKYTYVYFILYTLQDVITVKRFIEDVKRVCLRPVPELFLTALIFLTF